MRLSSSAEELLNDLLIAEKERRSIPKLLEERVLADKSDSIVRGVIRELKDSNCISIMWADNLPYRVELTQVGRTYSEFLDNKDDKEHFINQPKRKTYDLFLSHANADKIDYVDELYSILKKLGINIFYDKEELAWGDHWKNKILEGVSDSEFAIIVISENFFGREWTERELNQFLHLQNESGQKIILPLLYGIEFNDLKDKYPQLEFIQGIKSNSISKEDIALMFAKELIKRIKSVKIFQKTSDQQKSHSKLILKGIDDNNLVDSALLRDFTLPDKYDREDMLEKIHSGYETIRQIEVGTRNNGNSFVAAINKPIAIDENTIRFIKMCAEKLEIKINDDFFDLGNLSNDVVASINYFGNRSLSGSSNEKEKYSKILELEKSIYDFLGWVDFEKAFTGLKCVRLAVLNCGTNYDEDVDIEISLDTKFVKLPKNLPIPKDTTIKFINENSSLNEIFGISGTINFSDYASSQVIKPKNQFISSSLELPFSNWDYAQEYREELNNIFEYRCFGKGESLILKLHIDYIKHNTAVAFPTVLFLSTEATTIEYKISSKNNSAIINGAINVIATKM